MLLLLLLCIVFVITVFILGTYYAKVESVTKSGYPTREERCREQKMCGSTSTKSGTASGTTCCKESSPSRIDMDTMPCRNHGRRHCHVCYKDHDDGFSANGIILSTPAPFQ